MLDAVVCNLLGHVSVSKAPGKISGFRLTEFLDLDHRVGHTRSWHGREVDPPILLRVWQVLVAGEVIKKRHSVGDNPAARGVLIS